VVELRDLRRRLTAVGIAAGREATRVAEIAAGEQGHQ
jgi:hypothetical protein